VKLRRNWKTTVRLVAIAVLLLAEAIFVAQNYVAVDLRFLWWQWETHLSWVPVVLLLPGLALGWLLFRTRQKPAKSEPAQQRQS
jgi:uncharacterized integral membrane protein